jgi:hypothetical protein
VSAEDERKTPLAGKTIPVLVDVIAPGDSPLAGLSRLSADQRAALSADARFMLDELLDDCLPTLEARLRERLEQRIAALLGE